MRKKILRTLLPILFLGLALCLVSPAQAAIKLSAKKVVLLKGQSKTLKVKGTKKKVTWKSSKKSVVTVSSKGKLKAKKVGKATITAKVAGKTLKCTVIVDKDPHLDGGNIFELQAGNTLTMKVTGCTTKPTVKWSSSNNNVATVSKGIVTAKAGGKATISAKVLGKTLKYDIFVRQPAWEVTDKDLYYEEDTAIMSDYRFHDVIAWYAIVEVKNTGNVNLELYNCMIDIVNQNGTKMDTLSKDSWWGMKTFPKVIAPGEKGYFYGYSYFDLPDTPGSYSLRVGKPTLETKSDSIGKPLAINNMKLSSVKDSNGKTYPKVTFTVKNNSGSYQRDIQTGVIFYDKNGHVIGIEGNSGRGASLSAGDESGEHSYGGLALSPGCTYDRISTNVKVFSRSIY